MKPDLILHNAKVFTVNPNQPWAQAVACANGRIIAVGSNDDVLNISRPSTQKLNAQGKLVLPGLTDGHAHFLEYAVRHQQVSLLKVKNFSDVIRMIQERAKITKPGEWIEGWGWDETLWEGVEPTAALLDSIVPDIPIYLERQDMHTWWVNTKAMQLAKVLEGAADAYNCKIERDKEGKPTGIFTEWGAKAMFSSAIPAPTFSQLKEFALSGFDEAHKHGITCIHDQRMDGEKGDSWDIWQALKKEGKLGVRLHANLHAADISDVAKLGVGSGFGDENLWIGHVKVFADGTLGTRSAFMLEEYSDMPGQFGMEVTPYETFMDIGRRAQKAGLAISVHAIGDRAVRNSIEVFAKYPSRTIPHRIEHTQVIKPEDLPRLAKHNIFSSVQPAQQAMDWRNANSRWGERTKYAYAYRSLLNHGAVLVFGSDVTASPFNPMEHVYAAVLRQDTDGLPEGGWHPEECLTVAEAIRAYTMGPAMLSGKANVQGSISQGKFADLTVLSDNLFEIEPERILDVVVDNTIISGKVVFERNV
ncbi:MAG: amidohydrolase [Pseudomonadota bacterium]